MKQKKVFNMPTKKNGPVPPGEVAHGKRLSLKIQQLSNNKRLQYIFYTNMQRIKFSFNICGLWLYVMQVDVYKLDFVRL